MKTVTIIVLALLLVMPAIKDEGFIKTYFCSIEDCEKKLTDLILSASKTVDCAQYSFDGGLLQDAFDSTKAKVRLITDKREDLRDRKYAKRSTNSALMHNKFCIFDDYLITTGSFNPGGSMHDNNNFILIQSAKLSEQFKDEFNELWVGKKGEKRFLETVSILDANVTVLFCPEDKCANHLSELLQGSNKSVRFMTFSFTHPKVITELILAKEREVLVEGVLEDRQAENDGTYAKLLAQEIHIRFDGNPAIMHHKVFIIDEKILVTGSFNPTRNGDTRNDENMIVIRSSKISEEFLSEFFRVWECAALPTPPSCLG